MDGERVELEIVKMVGRGVGLAHFQGDTFMVSGALPGERVSAVVCGRRRGVVVAETETVLGAAHGARELSPCPHAPECGGCDWPHVQVTPGARLKALSAAEGARSAADLAAAIREAPVQTAALAYRLRARLHWDAEQRRLGFFRRRSWEVCAIPSCRIISPRLAAALPRLAAALTATCPEDAELEWLEDLDGEAAVAGLRRSARSPALRNEFTPSAQDLRDTVDGFHLIQPSGRSGAGWGATSVTMRLATPLDVPLGCFFQGNRHLVRWLSARVGELVGKDSTPVFDLHAGVGLLAAAAATTPDRQLVLVEPFVPAAEAAVRNLPTAEVAVGQTAEAFLRRRRSLPRRAVAITDPPRAGMSKELRHAIARWRPARLVTVACDAATWSRDAAYLLENGYGLRHLELVDLFPSTHHVEIVAVLESG